MLFHEAIEPNGPLLAGPPEKTFSKIRVFNNKIVGRWYQFICKKYNNHIQYQSLTEGNQRTQQPRYLPHPSSHRCNPQSSSSILQTYRIPLDGIASPPFPSVSLRHRHAHYGVSWPADFWWCCHVSGIFAVSNWTKIIFRILSGCGFTSEKRTISS